MTTYVIRRLLLAIPTLLAMLTVVFILVRLVPGDAAVAMLGDRASAEALAALRAQLGLDQPLPVQYLRFMGDMVTGNFGLSAVSGRTVLSEVAVVLPYTLELTAAAMIIGVAFGIPLALSQLFAATNGRTMQAVFFHSSASRFPGSSRQF